MSMRRLPKIELALARPAKLRFRPPQSALDRWNPELAAAKPAPADTAEINIMSVIGPYAEFGEVSAVMVRDALKAIGNAPVRMVINSPGGDAFEGIAIYNLLREHPRPVTAHIIGEASSAASVIAMAGDRIEMGEATLMMIHSASGFVMGNGADMREFADFLEQLDQSVAQLYSRRTANAVDDVLEMMRVETRMSAEQAVAKGFADVALAAEEPKKKKVPGYSAESQSLVQMFSKFFEGSVKPEALRAALGSRQCFSMRLADRSKSPGASGSRPVVSIETKPKGQQMKKITEQISSFEEKRAANVARMDAIILASDGRTFLVEEEEEYNKLDTEVKSIDKHLVVLRGHQARQVDTASTVDLSAAGAAGSLEANPDKASANRERTDVIRVESRLDKAIPFTRYVRAMCIAKGDPNRALQWAKAQKDWKDTSPQVERVLLAAVAAGDTTTAGWASELVYNQNLVNEFIAFLRPMTIIGRIPNLTTVPFNVRVAGANSGSSAFWVGQGKPVPVSKMGTFAVTLGIAKAAGMVVLDKELVLSSAPSAEMMVRNDLAKAVSQFVDTQFVSPDVAAVANVSPASITNGVVPTAATGTNSAALRTDVQTLFNGWISQNLDPSGGVWIMTPTQALAISLMLNALGQPVFSGPGNTINMNGGTFFGLPVVTSQSAQMIGSPVPTEGQLLILLNAPEIMIADDGQVTIDASGEASIEMLDNPTNQSTASPTATSQVSMFQTNSVALRATRFVNWAKRRSIAVQYIKDAAYVS
jgi:HK97 family phage major capsid protein